MGKQQTAAGTSEEGRDVEHRAAAKLRCQSFRADGKERGGTRWACSGRQNPQNEEGDFS